MIYNESSRQHECELCDFKREWRGNLQNHVLSTHYDVFLYRCPLQHCAALLRNWPLFQTHAKSHKTGGQKSEVAELQGAQHLLTTPVFVGEEEGLRIARTYHYFNRTTGQHQCKLCDFSSKSQQGKTFISHLSMPREGFILENSEKWVAQDNK